MARLIEATRIEQYILNNCSDNEEINAIYAEIVNAPTVDAVEVVRCKDCIHKPRGTRNKHDMEFPDDICPCQCEDYWYSWLPYDDWFCANGERKEDDSK